MIDEREVVTLGKHSDAFYARPEEDDRCYFDPSTASYLMKCELILEELMKVGVHTHERYDEAMAQVERIWKGN